MKSTLDHLPANKQHELRSIDETIRRLCKDVEMVILFGSYARGDYREEKDLSPQRKSGHVSDYDILVVTRHKATALDVGIWDEITRQVNAPGLSAHVKIVTHDIQELNIKLAEGQYFYTDIRKEGRVLYDSGRYALSEERELSVEDKKRIAQDHFNHWFKRATMFFNSYRENFSKGESDPDYFSMAAFNLHQAAEASYKTLLLVFTNYNPNEHLLDLLIAQTSEFSPELKDVFPRNTQEEKDLFGLLDYAYIGARYDPGYQISPSGLEYLASRVEMLMAVVESICKEKIEGIGE
jgi:predicted nucleotidyltransferase/HEPN domain-containing protein